MAKKRDIVVGRKGSSLTGTIENETFTVLDEFGEHKVKKSKISSIQYANPGSQPKDEIHMLNGDVYTGDVIEDPILLDVDGDVRELHESAVLAIMFGRKLDI